MNRKLGKLPARPGAVSFMFADVFDTSHLPVPPPVFGHWQVITDFGVLANDQVGDCIFAGGAHESMIFAMMGGRRMPIFDDANVVDDYSAVTGYDPNIPETDQGGDMEEAAAYRRKTGLMDSTGYRHRIDAYVALTPGDVEHLTYAMYLMGAAGMGFKMPQSAMDQTDAGEPWSVPLRHSAMIGGHYVPGVGRNADGNIVGITWGQSQGITPAFYERYSDEAVAYLSLDIMNRKNLSPDGFDGASVEKFIEALGA